MRGGLPGAYPSFKKYLNGVFPHPVPLDLATRSESSPSRSSPVCSSHMRPQNLSSRMAAQVVVVVAVLVREADDRRAARREAVVELAARE